MSYDPRLAGGPDEDDSGGKKGSVRAARERLQAAQRQLPDKSRIIGLPSRPNQLVSQFSTQNQPPAEELPPPNTRGNNIPVSPTPPWPLPNTQDGGMDSEPPQFPRPPNRGPPPQRPPRPFSDELPIQQPDDRASYQSEEYLSPTSYTISSRPLTTSSAASEASSLGSIPDFPVPQPPMPTAQSLPRRVPSLGPPPSSRRGPSSYYTQISYVSPIVEESESRSDGLRSHHGSFASSNVIPSNTEGMYREDDSVESDDDDTITSDYGRNSRGSDHDDRSELVQPALVRQASLGRRTKPSLMTIKSVDSLPVRRKASPEDTTIGAIGIGGAMLAARDGISGPSNSSLRGGTGLMDPSGSSSESLQSLRKINTQELDMEKEGLESPVHPLQQGARQTTLGERVGKRRPPRIDVDAVRDAEARGSLTSLPELIRRATRLAANLDRGRTASRLGLDFWESGALEKNKNDSRRSGSIRDMLAAFPPPGEATPLGNSTPNPQLSKWPSSGARFGVGADSALSEKDPKRRRKCCGMPMWTFVTLVIVLLFLIAAAVVIPVVLIVIPKIRDNQTKAAADNSGVGQTTSNTPLPPIPTASSQPGQCDGIITCQNGGVAIANSDRSCNCVCINGFTGKTCGTQSTAGCTTTNIASANNATIGTGIARLISSAQTNFSIPLDGASLLSAFSNLSLSCTAENALVTFNGLASRSIPIFIDTILEPSRSLPVLEEPHHGKASARIELRQAIGEVDPPNQNQNASSTTSTPVAQPISSNTTAIDFARICVLLVVQETRTLDIAANAQVALQNFLTNDRSGNGNNGNTVDLGPFTIDLTEFTVNFGNGTTLQARPASTTSKS
ncbi:hypothetical protein P154DRAFT_420616 [Amniculicola lignicola CBS 123094]|uniref:EGF-like domain-containing protein n=1 Tax=Amniculicola lignicola CBS 123094 TaxID=1392246 RepID=A0A6A5X1V7_9PLEO|nr:hypothetical protein P154DRAFT_420616 [Amniculicola lignicola CBS 123094]